MYDITPIKNYILYLKKECGLAITLHIEGIDFIVTSSELISFNIHDNPYCIYVKSCEQAQKRCIEKHPKIVEKCKNGAFVGICHAGVKEYVYPISNGEQTIGFISVSGYKCGQFESYLKAISDKYALPIRQLRSTYHTLKEELPPQEQLDTLLTPLCQMLELAYRKTADKRESEESFADRLVRYLKKHHTQNITSKDICVFFACSRSKVSHLFNSHMGMSIKQYINLLRIEDAKSLLKNSDLTVTEVAYSVGFSDSNYFTGIFKKQVGMTPLQYRKTP